MNPGASWAVVLGPGRSGSTVLDLELGRQGVIAVGELHHVWQRAGVENQQCGCGLRAHDCPFWTSVLNRALGPEWPTRCQELEAIRLEVATYRAWPWLYFSASWRGRARPLIEATSRLAAAIEGLVPAGSVIWDSSKSTPHATILAAAGLRPVLVLLTRDPADVAFSWARPKARVEADGRPMPRHGWLASGARWDFAVISALIEARRRRRPLVHVTYENLVDGGTPPDAIAAHFRRSNTPPSPEWLHAIGGNPARWTSANGPMVRDSRRHQEQSGAVTMAARLAALPGLLALAAGYGLGWVDKVSPGYRTTPDRDPFVTSPEARAPAATPPPPDRD